MNLLQFKNEEVNEVSIQKSTLETCGMTHSAIRTIEEISGKEVENNLIGKIESFVTNIMVVNNLVDQGILLEVESSLRKEVEVLDENIGKDLDGV